MKFIFLLLACSIYTASSQVVADYPLRRFGTNIFDFTPVMQSVRPGATNSQYLVAGEVLQTVGNAAHVVRQMVSVRISREFQKEMLLAGPGKQLQMLQAAQMVQRPGGISAGEFNAASPEVRRMYMDAREQVVDYLRVFVTNCPSGYLVPGKQVRLFAMPAGTYTFVDSQHETQSIPRFDYGHPLTGDSTPLTSVFLVTPGGLVRKETPAQLESKKAAIDAKLLAWQLEQASNGVPRLQYDLGKRHLDGNGVPKDEALGRYWIGRSAAQDYEAALRLLKELQGKGRK